MTRFGAAAQFGGATLIHHEAAQAENVWQLATTLTFDYAKTKAHVTAGLVDALRVWWDWGVWPATVVSLPLGVMGIVGALYGTRRRRLGTYTRRDAARIGLLVWVIVGMAVVVGRGTLGARFHLMYLPALWMLAALTVSTFRRSAQTWVLATFVVLATVSLLKTGPTRWAPCARFEPMTGSAELVAFDAYRQGETSHVLAHKRTLYIDLANYYMVKSNPTPADGLRAIHFARLETQRIPDDARAWAYLGEALLRSGAPSREVRSAWKQSLKLSPNDKLRARLDRLGE